MSIIDNNTLGLKHKGVINKQNRNLFHVSLCEF